MKMKKVLFIALLFVMMIGVPVMAGSYKRYHSSSSECLAGGCHAPRCKGSSYCRDHKCCIYECTNKRGSDGMYCSKHHNQYYQSVQNHSRRNSSRSSSSRSSSSRSSSSRSSSSRSSSSRSSSSRSSSSRSSSSRSGSSSSNSSRKKSIDPDDYDIEGYYEDNRDEYDDYDDAYDGFLDDEDAWDDY